MKRSHGRSRDDGRPEELDELAFLAGYDASRYPRPSVAVDVVLFTVDDGALRTLLLHRSQPPHAGHWALPGGFVGIDEALDAAAARVLWTKAGVEGVFTEQLFTFGGVERDPRTRVISVTYYALVEPDRLKAAVAGQPGDDRFLAIVHAQSSGSLTVHDPADGAALALAFDHAEILGVAVDRIRGKLGYAPIGFELLPPVFSLRDLRLVHEAILGRPLNKDSFRRSVLDRRLVVPTGERATGVGHRPPELYGFARPQGRRNR